MSDILEAKGGKSSKTKRMTPMRGTILMRRKKTKRKTSMKIGTLNTIPSTSIKTGGIPV